MKDVISQAMKIKRLALNTIAAHAVVGFAIKTKEKRKAKKMSQKQLAEKVLTTQRRISNIETFDTNVGIETFINIAKVLDFTIDDLVEIFGIGSPQTLSREDK